MKFKTALTVFVILFCSCGFLKEKLAQEFQKKSEKVKAVTELENDVMVKVFISSDLPEPYKNLNKEVEELLKKYKSASDKFHFEILDPLGKNESENSKLKKEAEKYGIEQVFAQTLENETGSSSIKAYVAAVLISGDRNILIDKFDNAASFEKLLLAKMKNISRSTLLKIGFLTGHGEVEYKKQPKSKAVLSKEFQIENVSLGKGEPVPSDIETLVIAGPKEKFKESELFLLDQFIMREGKILWMINAIVPNFDEQTVTGDKNDLNLNDFFANYGIKINDNLVRDLQCSSVNVESKTGRIVSVKYPYFPMVTAIDTSIGIFKNTKSVAFTFVSTVEQISASEKSKMRTLLMTSEQSGITDDKKVMVLNLEQFQDMSSKDIERLFDKGPQRVGAIFSGMYKSYFSGRPAPSAILGETLNESKKPSTMIVIGDGDFMNEENRPPAENITFFVDLIEYLSDVN